jgi:single-strand DNA-binding protein
MYQKLIIVGRLGKDPEMRFTPTGAAVTTFSVATDRQWTDGAGKPAKETTWFRVQAWNKLAESCNSYLQKGKLVMVEGRLNVDPKTGGPRIWEGDDHVAHAMFELTASTVKFLSPHGAGSDGAPAGETAENIEQEPSEEIPF